MTPASPRSPRYGGRSRPGPPGMADVADVAGVSHQTVSRVINDHPSVRPETRARVLAAIEALGYRPNTAARALVTRRSKTIGVLTTGEARFGPTSTLIAVEEAAREAGYYVSLALVHDPTAADVASAMEHFMGQGVEGVIVITPRVETVEPSAAAGALLPVVIVAAGETPGPGVRVASVDQQQIGALATRHLLELGHPDVVHLSGPDDWYDAIERVRGWQAERARWGLPPVPPIGGDWTPGCGYDVARRLIERAASGRTQDALPTAIFAANDQLALGALRAFGEAGVDVPGQVSVVGVDDIEGADFFSPPLTTVRQDFAGLGQRCVELLLAELPRARGAGVDDAALATVDAIAPQLVVRASTGPPPRSQRDGGR